MRRKTAVFLVLTVFIAASLQAALRKEDIKVHKLDERA